ECTRPPVGTALGPAKRLATPDDLFPAPAPADPAGPAGVPAGGGRLPRVPERTRVPVPGRSPDRRQPDPAAREHDVPPLPGGLPDGTEDRRHHLPPRRDRRRDPGAAGDPP